MKFKALFVVGVLLFGSAQAFAADVPSNTSSDASIVEQYPKLQNYIFEEPSSKIQIGFGLSPFGIIRDQYSLSASLFQVHWTTPWLDWEIFNVSFAMTLNSDETSKSRQFVFRTSPKYRLGRTFSIGPVLGYEFVTFPGLDSVISNGTLATPPQPFSSRGLIYGGAISETFALNKTLNLKLNQVVYKETYSTTNAPENGWVYRYNTPGLNKDQSSIAAGTVFLLEFSVLY